MIITFWLQKTPSLLQTASVNQLTPQGSNTNWGAFCAPSNHAPSHRTKREESCCKEISSVQHHSVQKAVTSSTIQSSSIGPNL